MAAAFGWSSYEDHEFDRTLIRQSRLDISGSRRVNSLPWRGQFSPELAELLISEFLDDGTVIDPFCGSGTTLIESARLGRSSIGSEINPAAYILARIYELASLTPEQRQGLIARLAEGLSELNADSPSFEQVSRWARDTEVGPDKCVRDAIFLLAAGNDSAIKPKRLEKAVEQVSSLVRSLPIGDMDISISLGDARRLDAPGGSADGLLTSPPYINVFNYHQNYRNAVESLGWAVLSSAKAEFGSNRKHRQNRFLTVIQYAQDITETIQESVRVLKPGATSVWVVGRESKVRGVAMPNPLIVFEAATRGGGLSLLSKHERSFTSRYGQRVFEDILVFAHPAGAADRPLANAADLGREIGSGVLSTMLDQAGDVAHEVEAAIAWSPKVCPSEVPDFVYPSDVQERQLQAAS